jgi:drug/metabolite transporter (DMT)-like permease
MEVQAKTYYWAVGLSLAAAVGFALNSNLAAVAYTHGANPLSVLTLRSIIGALALFLVLKIKKFLCICQQGRCWLPPGSAPYLPSRPFRF